MKLRICDFRRKHWGKTESFEISYSLFFYFAPSLFVASFLSEIPDQLQEKLSLGLLGREAIVRLDGELDKDVPACTKV